MFVLALLKRLQNSLIFIVLLLIIGQTIVQPLPIATDVRVYPERQIRITGDYAQLRNVQIKDDICANKGKFCEIICKNNPSEGGKMCK